MTPASSRPSKKAVSATAVDEADAEPADRPAEDLEIAKLSYEDARDALVDIVRRLEGGAETLEESLALWERGEALAQHCERWLAGAQAQLDAATATATATEDS